MASIKVDIIGDNSSLLDSLNEAKKGVDNAAKNINDAGRKIDDVFDNLGNNAGKSLRELKQELKDLEKGLNEVNEAVAKIGNDSSVDEYTKKIERANEKIAKLKAQGATKDGYDGMSAQLRQVEERLRSYTEKLEEAKRVEQRVLNDKANYEEEIRRVRESIDNYGKSAEKGAKSTKDLGAAQKKAASDAKEFSDSQKIATQASSDLHGMMSTIAKLSGGYLTVKGIEKFISKTIEARGQLELMQTQFEGLMGDEGANVFKEIKGMAASSGLYSSTSLAEAAKQLNLYGIETENIIPMLRQFEDVAMGNQDTIQQLAIAFGRLESQGTLTNISLRSMLRTGFNPLEEISRTTGKSMHTLRAEMKAGQITTEMVKDALQAATQEGGKFYKMNEKVSDSIKAEQGKLQIAYSKMFVELGEGYDETIKNGYRFAQAVVGHYKEIIGVMSTLIASYGAYRVASLAVAAHEAALNAHYVTKIRLLRAAVVAQQMLNAAMNMNPYVLAATAIAGVTTALFAFSKSSNVAGGEMDRVKERAQKQGEELENLRSEVRKNIDAINDDTKSEGERTEALETLKRLLPSVFERYNNWIELQKNLAEATRSANEQLAIQNNVSLGKNIQHDKEMLKDLKTYRETLKGFFNGDEERAAKLNLIKKYPELFGIDSNGEAFKKNPEMFINVAFKDKGTFETDWHFVNSKILQVTKSVNDLNEDFAEELGKKWGENLPVKNLTDTNKELNTYISALNKLKKQQEPVELQKRWKQQNPGMFELAPNSDNLQQMKLELSTVIVNGEELTQKEIERRIKSLRAHASEVTKNEGKDYLEDAKKAYEDAQKGVQKVINDRNKTDSNGVRLYPTEQAYKAALKQAQDELKQKELAYKSLGGDPKSDKSSLKQAQKSENEQAQFREKVSEEEKAWSQKQIKQAYDAAKARSEAEIAGMEEGFEKTIAVIENGYKNEQDLIDQKEASFRKENYEHAKRLYDADPANKGAAFSDMHSIMDDAFNLTKTQQVEIDALREKSEKEYRRQIRQTFEDEMQQLYDYIKEYGSIQDKKAAISREYDMKISHASGAAQKAVLEAERDAMMSNLKFDELQDSINWESVFNDIDRLSVDYLKRLKERLKESLSMDDISVENAKVLAEKIREIEDTISDKTDIVSSLLPGLKERKRLTQEAAEAEREWREALENVVPLMNQVINDRQAIQSKLSTIGIKVELDEITEENRDKILDSLDESSELYKALKELFDQLGIDLAKLGKGNQTVAAKRGDLDRVNDILNGKSGLSDIFSFIGGTPIQLIEGINANAQSLSEMVDNFGLADTDFGEAVHNFADGCQSFTNVIGDLLNGDVFGAVNDIMSGVASWSKIFYAGGNEDEMEERIAELSEANEGLAKSIDSLAERISKSDSTNEDSLNAYIQALQAEKEWEENQRNAINARASEWTNTGYGFLGLGGKHSFNAEMASNNWEGWKVFSDLLKGKYGTGAGYEHKSVNRNTIWELTPEEMQLLRDFAPKEWAALMSGDGHKNPSELIDEYINRAGQIEELTEALNEKLTGYTWEGFLDSYKDLLKDLTSETEDFGDKIEDLISNALLESLVNEEFQKRIRELYNYIAEHATDGLDANELDYIRNENKRISEEMIARRQALIDAGMLNIDSSEEYKQKASSKGFAAMSQDTAEELNGRFTALQIAGENVSSQMIAAVALLSSISSFGNERNIVVSEIRDQIAFANSYLEDMVSYSKKIFLQFGEKIDKIVEQTKNI